MSRAARRSSIRCSAFPALVALLVLAGCGSAEPSTGPSPAPAASSGQTPATAPDGSGSSTSTDPAATFCREVRANGGTGASFGPIPTFYRRKPLLVDVQDKLDTMGTLVPPAEIAEPWALQKRTLLRVKAAARPLTVDQTLADLPDVDLKRFHGGKIDDAQQTLTDYYFAHCR